MSHVERSTYLLTAPDAVLVHHHAPDHDDPGRPAVLLVPPFGWDDVASYRTRRDWALALAAAGHHALRLDLPGTGDSAGTSRDPGRLDAWVAATTGAAAWLRRRSGAARVVAIGLRTGGTVAWLAAAAGAPIDDLLLWGVPARGRALARELRAFAMLKANEWRDPEPPAGTALPEGWLDVAGYLLSAETVAALSAVDLSRAPLSDPQKRRVLLLERDGVKVDERLREHLTATGIDVQVQPGPGWSAMTSGPQEARSPETVFAAVGRWLADADAERLAPDGPVPEEASDLELDGVVERPWTARRSFGRQLGILATPAGGGPAPLGVVLVNGGAVRHTGPNRMWVEAARRWASRDVPVLRLDIEGLGDSDGDGQPYVDSAKLYAPALAKQVRDTVADLVAQDVASRWMIAGLCAGASWAFHAALDGDERISGAVLVNPFAFYWDDDLVGERDAHAARRLVRASAWKPLLAGEVDPARIRATALRAARTPVELRARRRRRRDRVRQVDDALDRARDAGKHLTLLLGNDEAIYDRLAADRQLARLDRWPNLELRRIPTRDHTFRAAWLQAHVHGLLDDALDAAVGREQAAWDRAQ